MKSKPMFVGVVGVLLLVAIVGVVAFGGKDDVNDGLSNMEASQMEDSPATQQNSAQTATVTSEANALAIEIKDFAFTPATIKIKAGTTVTWTNKDSVQHNVVADKESSDAPKSELLAKDESYEFTFNKPGTYSYHCSPHPNMKGTVIVE